jgi:hypothetical protein
MVISIIETWIGDEMDNPSNPTKKFNAYMNQVLKEHVIHEDEEQVILDVTAKEAEIFGLFIIRVVAGWARGCKRARFLHQFGEKQSRCEVSVDEEEIEKSVEDLKKAFIN